MGERSSSEETIATLRELDVRLPRGETAVQAARLIGGSEQTCYRWRKAYDGHKDAHSHII
nr:helix-turn-helix domain-containing protein [uncultured Hyphomonas sp.]